MKRSNDRTASRDINDSKRIKKVKLSRQEKKQLIKDEITSKKVEKKMITRAHNDNVNSKKPSDICITLGKMAYDLARSGTASHLDDLTASLPFLIPAQHPVYHSNPQVEVRAQQALLFAEAAYLLALSGISLRTSIHHPGADCPEASTVLDLLVHHAICSLTNAAPGSNLNTMGANSTKGTLLAASQSLMRMLEYFAIAGLGLHPASLRSSPYHFSRLSEAITLMLSAATTATTTAIDPLKESILTTFLSRQTSSRARGGGTGFSAHDFWLHSPCGSPLTALWFHR
jgi:hypothetical protein